MTNDELLTAISEAFYAARESTRGVVYAQHDSSGQVAEAIQHDDTCLTAFTALLAEARERLA